jgi:DNA-binding NtrC family response regulator
MTEATNTTPTTKTPPLPIDTYSRREISILVVDDEPGIRNFLQRALSKEYGLVEAVDRVEAAEALRIRCRFDILIVDVSLPGQSGLDWVAALHQAGERCDVIFITAYADLNATIGAIRAGATDFILKPFRVEQLLAAVKRCVANRAREREMAAFARAEPVSTDRGEGDMIGTSPAIEEVRRVISRVAPTPASVLIEGETGSGKELVASAIHCASGRRGLMVAINCIAIAPELFESELFGHTKGAFTGAHQAREGLFIAAKGGTLFLDEISEMPVAMQAKLLRALETRRVRPVGADQEVPVDVRLVTASNRDLGDAVRKGLFREDLYFRLNVVGVKVPALRERTADIPDLLDHFSRRLAQELGVSPHEFRPDEIERLQTYSWPGNVRELRNVVERTLLLGRLPLDSIGAMDAPTADTEQAVIGFPAAWPLDEVEKHHTLRVLRGTQGNKSEAARRLGISRKTLERKLATWPEARRPLNH